MRVLIGLVLVTLFLFLAVTTKNAYERGGSDPLEKNTITVSADVKKAVKPDTAEISFTIRKENALLVIARDEVSKLSNAVTEYLKSEGVEEKDIKSTSFNIYPQEIYDSRPCILESGASIPCPPRKTVKTYVVEETFEVKVKKLDTVGEVISGVTNAGVNQVSSLRFVVNDETLEMVRKEARDEAIKKAKGNAAVLAHSLDVRLGNLVSFNESGNNPPPVFYEKFGRGGATFDNAASPVPAIAPGENEVVSSVSLTYEIR